MSSKAERDRRRADRLEAERREAAAQRRRLAIGYVVAGGLTLAVIVGIVVALGGGGGDETQQVNGKEIPDAAHIQVQSGFPHDVTPDGREGTPPPALAQGDLQAAADQAGCELMLDLPDEGNSHVTKQEDIPDYRTDPPTSGNHNPNQQADGAYGEMPEPWYFVHALEHGRIEIQYSPDLAEADQLALKGVFDEDPDGMLLFPNDQMAYEVAATAWTQMIGCRTYAGRSTLDAVRDFRDIFRGQGPESGIPVHVPS